MYKIYCTTKSLAKHKKSDISLIKIGQEITKYEVFNIADIGVAVLNI